MKTPLSSYLCALCFAFSNTAAFAAEFIVPVSVTSTAPEFYSVQNLIQGPGIGFEDTEPYNQLGVGSASRWVTTACGFPCDYLAGGDPPVIVLDLGENTNLSEISIWGYSSTNANGVKEFMLRFATEAEGETGFGSSITYNPTFQTSIDDVKRQSSFFDKTIRARYVEVTCTDNYFTPPGTGGPDGPAGGDRVGLGEIAFEKFVASPQPNLVAPANLTIPPTRVVTEAIITLRNTGVAPLNITGVALSGTDAAAFTVVSRPSTLTTLQTGEVKLRFTPGSLLGAVTASLTLATNDPDTPSFEILLAASVPLAPLEFYPITSVTSSTEGDDLYVVANLIQGLGSGFSSNFPHDQLGGGSTHRWVTTACGYPCDYLGSLPPPVIILDLGENRALQEINVWGYTGANDNGVKEFQLRFATAAEGIVNFGKSITYNPTFLIEDKSDLPRLPFPFQRSINARFVEFTCIDNFFQDPGTAGGDRVGLGEIAFPKSTAVTPSAPFVITGIARNATTRAVSLTFNSETGKTYTIKRSTNLISWTNLATGVPATGGSTVYTDTTITAANPVFFYRIAQP